MPTPIKPTPTHFCPLSIVHRLFRFQFSVFSFQFPILFRCSVLSYHFRRDAVMSTVDKNTVRFHLLIYRRKIALHFSLLSISAQNYKKKCTYAKKKYFSSLKKTFLSLFIYKKSCNFALDFVCSIYLLTSYSQNASVSLHDSLVFFHSSIAHVNFFL